MLRFITTLKTIQFLWWSQLLRTGTGHYSVKLDFYIHKFFLVCSGIPQGKLIKRQRLPKNDLGDFWHWKDLNIGIDITFYGKVFHIHDCDKWTAVS